MKLIPKQNLQLIGICSMIHILQYYNCDMWIMSLIDKLLAGHVCTNIM